MMYIFSKLKRYVLFPEVVLQYLCKLEVHALKYHRRITYYSSSFYSNKRYLATKKIAADKRWSRFEPLHISPGDLAINYKK